MFLGPSGLSGSLSHSPDTSPVLSGKPHVSYLALPETAALHPGKLDEVALLTLGSALCHRGPILCQHAALVYLKIGLHQGRRVAYGGWAKGGRGSSCTWQHHAKVSFPSFPIQFVLPSPIRKPPPITLFRVGSFLRSFLHYSCIQE